VLSLAGRWAGRASTSKVGDGGAGLGVGDAGGSSFATYFATVSNAATTTLSAFTQLALTLQPSFWIEVIELQLLNNWTA
jgi:hypothetical protein